MAFELNPKFIAEIQTEEDVLRHIFRVPGAREWQNFISRRFMGTEQTIKQGDNEFHVDIGRYHEIEMEIASALWEACIESVEGYEINGEPLTSETKGWKGKVWFPHKIAAIEQLIKFYEAKQEKLEKN